ncbi:MAG: ankyrin repeat domain-containing protein [Proteobacteria bacterium]|nr:ankyrin repeat domain-containing protein [Pseudomonadota bacterium]MBU1741295.1 ankyrin repeat domain-containing protein [Pseudomonadota bacterium]
MKVHVLRGWRPVLVALLFAFALGPMILVPATARAQDGNIFEAVKSGNLAAVKSILDSNPQAANARGKNRYTPLIWAARKGYLNIVKLLLARGADINGTNKWNNGSLHWAAYNGQVPVVEYLCQKGARMDVAEIEKGHMPLHDAAWKCRVGVVRVLVKHGAPVNARNKFGQTPAQVALKYKCTAVANLLGQQGGGPKPSGDAMSVDQARARLFAAVKAGDVNTARSILNQFPKLVNARGKNRYTPLIWAARRGSLPLVAMLVAKGAGVNLVNKWNNTSLHWAAYNGHTAVIIYLTRKGARTDVAEIEKGHMPLHDAAWKCRLAAAAALLKAGAPATARNKFGQTPADVALKYKCPAVANLIQRHIQGGGGGAAPPATDPKAALFQAVKAGDLRGAALILAKNPALANARGKNRYTPLMWAARKGGVAMCALLIMKGADINATNKWNNTSLHWAAYNGHASVVSYLLRKGARSDVREIEKGHMPLHDAAWKGHGAVVLLLIKGGAPINARNKFGQTPLAVALKYKKMGVAQILRQNGGTQ